MNNTIWLVFIMALALTLYTGAQAVPLLALLYAPRVLKFWFISGAESESWITASPLVQQKIQQLREFGFVQLGIKGEKILWQKPVYEVSLTNREKGIFAAIMLTGGQSAAGADLFRVLGVYFYTPLQGKGIVFTRGRSSMSELESKDASVKNFPGGDINAMLASHSQRVGAFKKNGVDRLPVTDQAARIEATYIFYESKYMRRARRNLPRILPAINFALALVLLIAVTITVALRLSGG